MPGEYNRNFFRITRRHTILVGRVTPCAPPPVRPHVRPTEGFLVERSGGRSRAATPSVRAAGTLTHGQTLGPRTVPPPERGSATRSNLASQSAVEKQLKHPLSGRCPGPKQKRWRATALQDAGALAEDSLPPRSVLECASPLAFWANSNGVASFSPALTFRAAPARNGYAG